jgi:nitrite reductase/ring-hydroxylating ferredoxin subunit
MPLGWKKDAYLSGDQEHIFCSGHAALFDIATGACTLGPCMGQSLTPVEVSISENGDVRFAIDSASLPRR